MKIQIRTRLFVCATVYEWVCLCHGKRTNSLGGKETWTRQRWERHREKWVQMCSHGFQCSLHSLLCYCIQKIRENNRKKTFDMRTETIVLSLLSISTIVPHFSSTETWTNTKRSSWIHASHAMFYAWNSLGCGFLTFNRQRKPTTHWKKHQAKWIKKHQQQQLILNIPIAPSITVNSQRRSA